MIYIYKGLQTCCSLPALACDSCGECCEISCHACCKWPTKVCTAFCRGFSHTFSRPLAWYVLLTCIMMIWSICAALGALAHPNFPDICATKVRLMLLFDVLFAVVSIAFAFYIQWTIWETLCDLVDEESIEQNRTGKKAGKNIATLLMEATCHVLKYNFCFCFYFFFLIGYLVWNCFGSGWAQLAAGCDPAGQPSTVAWLGIVYVILVFVYSFHWWVFMHCHNACEHCLAPCGGFTCCFGSKPLPRARAIREPENSSDSDSNSGAEMFVPGTDRQPRRGKDCVVS